MCTTGIILFNYVGWFHDLVICQIYIYIYIGSLGPKQEYSFTIHASRLTLEKLGGVILPTL
jgi:hypothetical protein